MLLTTRVYFLELASTFLSMNLIEDCTYVNADHFLLRPHPSVYIAPSGILPDTHPSTPQMVPHAVRGSLHKPKKAK